MGADMRTTYERAKTLRACTLIRVFLLLSAAYSEITKGTSRKKAGQVPTLHLIGTSPN